MSKAEFFVSAVGGSDTHPFRECVVSEDESKLPLLKGVGFMRLPEKNTYVSYTVTTQGSRVVRFEVQEPNLRAVAEDCAKMDFVTHFCNEEF